MSEWRGRWVAWPEWAKGNAEIKQNIRNVVGGRVRRVLTKIILSAAGRFPFAAIAEQFYVKQESTAEGISFEAGNDHPHYYFADQDVKPHEIPANPTPRWIPIAAFAKAPNPFAAQASVAKNGTKAFMHPGSKGRHIFDTEWDKGEPDVVGAIDSGMAAIIERWGMFAE